MKNDWQKALDARPMVVLGLSEYQRLCAAVAECAATYVRGESIEDLVADLGPGVPDPNDTVDGVNLVAEPVARQLNPSSPLLGEDVDFLLDALEVRLALSQAPAPTLAPIAPEGYALFGDDPLAGLIPPCIEDHDLEFVDDPLAELVS